MKELTLDDLFKGPFELYIYPWILTNLPKLLSLLFIVIAIIAFLTIAGCKLFSKPKPPASNIISTAEVAKHLENGDNMLLIDVRVQKEFIDSHIKTAMNIPLRELAETLDNLGDKREKFLNTPIVIHCRTMNRVKKAYQIFIDKGFTKVQIMKGGFKQWKSEGRTYLRGKPS